MDQISNASAHPSKDSIFKVTLDLLTTTLFLVFTGGLFVAFSIFLGKYELLILAFVLLGSSCFRSVLNPEQRKKYEMTPLVGEGLRIYNKLEQHYLHNAPRSIFYYLLFPITGIWSFFFSKKQGRSELKAYFGLIQWIIVLLVAESFTSYFRFYNQFKLSFVLSWFYLELLCIYFLCNFFAVPLSTSSLKLSLAGKQKRLFASTFLALIIMSGFLYLFLSNGSYKNIIPVNILLDQRMATLQPLSQNLSAEEKRRQAFLHPKKSYFQRFEAKTKMFLNHHAPKILAFNRSYYPIPSQKQSHLFYQDLNQKYQKHIAPLSVFNEEEHFFISTTRGTNEIWGILVIPFRESVLYIFHFKAGKLKLYHKWKDIPSPERKKLRKRWAPGLFVFGRQKRFSQIIVEYARNKVKDLQQVPSPASPDYPGKQERKSRSKKKKRSYPAEEGYPRPPAAGSSLMKKSQTGRSKSAARIQKSELRKRRLQSFKNLIAKRNQAIEIWKKWSLPLLQGFHTIPTIKNQNVYTFFNSKWPKEWKKRSQSLFWTRLSKLSKSLDQKDSTYKQSKWKL